MTGWATILPWLALAVVAAALLPVLDIGFLADDWLIIASIHQDQVGAADLGDHARAIVAPTWAETYELFRPATVLLLHLELRAFGPDPQAFHAVGLFLWLASTLVVASVVRRLLEDRSHGWAAVAVLLFGAWPATIEALGWCAAQSDLLSLFWSVCALRLMLAGRSLPTVTCVLLATLSKETAVILPLLLVLVDRCSKARVPARAHLATFAAAGAYLGMRALRFGGLGTRYAGRSYLELLEDRGGAGIAGEVGRSLHRLVVPVNDLHLERQWAAAVTPLHVVLLAAAAAILFLLARNGRGRRWLGLAAVAWTVLPLVPVVVPLDGVGEGLGRSRLLVLPAVGWSLVAMLALHGSWVAGQRRLAGSLCAILVVAGLALARLDLQPYAEATRRVDRLTTSLTGAAPQGAQRVIIFGIEDRDGSMRRQLVSFGGCHLLAGGLYDVARPPFVAAPGYGIQPVKPTSALARLRGPGSVRPAILHLDVTAVPPAFRVVAPGGQLGPALALKPAHGRPWKVDDDSVFVVTGPADLGQQSDTVRVVVAEPERGDHAVGLVEPVVRNGRLEVRVPPGALRAAVDGRTDGPPVTAEAIRNAPGRVIVWWAEIRRGDRVLARSPYNVVPVTR